MKKMMWIVAVLSIQCSGGGPDDSATLDDANARFQAGQYADALAIYIGLIGSEGSPALVGAGWCEIFLSNYTSAESYFSQAAGDSLAEGYAGWAFTLWALNQPAACITKADVVIALQPNFVFSLDERIRAKDLYWLEASSYLQLSNYSKCLEFIQKIEPTYTTDLNDVLNVSGTLLTKLQSLGGAVGKIPGYFPITSR